MGKKRRFKWREDQERSIAELISAEGPLHAEVIYSIIQELCVLLDSQEAHPGRQLLCPSCILVNSSGKVRLVERELSFAEIGPYLAPEQDRPEMSAPSAKVYALGMLMLYMATGQEKKTDAESSLSNSALLSIIQRCMAFDRMNRYEDLRALHDAVKRERRIGRKALPIVLGLLLVGVLAAAVFAAWRAGAARGAETGDSLGYAPGYAEGYDRGSSAAPGIGMKAASVDPRNGNLSGNYSAGEGPTAAYSEKSVFFLLEGDLVEMDAVTGQTQLLAASLGNCSLQYYQGFLYCCTPEHVLRINPETKKQEIFCDSLGGSFAIFEDTFYLYDSANTRYLYRVSLNGKKLTQLSGAMECRCLNVVGGILYYLAPDKGNGICSNDVKGSDERLISSSSYESFCICGGKLWVGTPYGLIRMDLNGGNPETMTAMPAFSPNAVDGGVFYLSGSERTLQWMSADGRTFYTVVPTRTSSFQVAGQWILYRNEEDGGRLWRVRVSGADNGRASLN